MLTKEPEMLQPDVFCEHTMQQNATAAGAPPNPTGGAYSAPPDPLAGIKGSASRRGGEGEGGEWVDFDVQLEQGHHRLAKAGPAG